MSTLIVTEFVSLDGVMEAPGGEGEYPHAGWTMDYENEGQWYGLDDMREVSALLIGRTTYESFASAWPNYEGDFADAMNNVAKVVVSSTLTDPAWNNTTVLSGDVVAGVTELKSRAGGPILVGGSQTLVHTLLENDLVDELRLVVYPVLLGVGLRVFPGNGKKIAWDLAESTTYPSGIRLDRYVR